MDVFALILVIDDDPVLLQAMVRVLQMAGNRVIEASTGAEGLRLAKEHRPDLMIVDLMLPDMDGLEVCLQTQADPELAEMESILISSIRTSSEEQADGLAAGVCEYIARPMPNREFLARVEARLREKKARDSIKKARDKAWEITGEDAEELVLSKKNAREAIESREEQKQGRINLEEELQAIFAHAPICLFLTDGEARLSKANPAVAELFGGDVQSLIGQPCGLAFGCVYNADHSDGCGFGTHCGSCVLRNTIIDTFNTDIAHAQVETTVTRRQEGGAIKHFARFSTSPVMVSGQKRVFVCMEDITERKKIEKTLDYERNRFKQILEAFPHGIYIADQDYTLEYTNPTLERLFGPVQGQKCYEYFHNQGEPCSWCKSQEAFQGHLVRWEQHSAKTNRIYDLIDIPLHNEDGTLSRLEVIQDITERKQSEATLHASEEKNRFLAELLHSTSHPFTAGYPDGEIFFINPAACNLVGYSEAELGALSWSKDLTPPEWQEFSSRMMSQLVLTGEPVCYEKEYFHKDGRRIPVELKVHVRHYPNGASDLFYSFTTDLTERKRLEKQAKELNEQLFQAQKMESVGRLAGGVAHDYNNMLSVILGYTEMALEETDPASSLHENLQQILNAAERSANITRQLLAFARKQAIAPKVLDINDNVEGMIRMLKRLIGEDINLIWLPTKDLKSVKIDPSQLDQLLANLCVNARDAISGVGKITIETGKATFDTKYCSQHRGAVPGKYVLLAVSDNGHGMEKEILDKIFEPFFTTKELGRGTGLGLATVYGIVKQNKGFVDVFSVPNEGTTFKVYLPQHFEHTIEVVKEHEVKIQRGVGETVLVVEDEAVLLKLADRILTDLGYTVLTANTSAEAVRLAHDYAGKIDMLLSDVIMPEMNGRDLFELILTFRPDLKCLFMSGYTATIIASQGVLEEGVQFIQKPFSARNLAVKIREVLLS